MHFLFLSSKSDVSLQSRIYQQSALWPHRPWRDVMNIFELIVHSKEYTFAIFLFFLEDFVPSGVTCHWIIKPVSFVHDRFVSCEIANISNTSSFRIRFTMRYSNSF